MKDKVIFHHFLCSFHVVITSPFCSVALPFLLFVNSVIIPLPHPSLSFTLEQFPHPCSSIPLSVYFHFTFLLYFLSSLSLFLSISYRRRVQVSLSMKGIAFFFFKKQNILPKIFCLFSGLQIWKWLQDLSETFTGLIIIIMIIL
jgi:hypothetical protein